MADIEISNGQWPDLIPSLLQSLTSNPARLPKKSIMQCIGFVCETVVTIIDRKVRIVFLLNLMPS